MFQLDAGRREAEFPGSWRFSQMFEPLFGSCDLAIGCARESGAIGNAGVPGRADHHHQLPVLVGGWLFEGADHSCRIDQHGGSKIVAREGRIALLNDPAGERC